MRAKICLIIVVLLFSFTSYAETSFRSGLLIYTIYSESDDPYVSVTDNTIYEKTDIVIPDIVEHEGIRYPVRSIGSNAFKGCKNISSVIVESKVRSIGECSFYNCSLERIILPDSLQSIGYSAFTSSRIHSIDIPDACIYIDSDGFYTCLS
ncbi:MAG: leucine-rich repeat domain-containing protein [Muribaculaceae bacterium]|nr:leucine-rich repeat domain-containing protein [Muribaculaceae bacterium]